MSRFKGVLRVKRNRMIVLLLTFLVIDVVLISYTFSFTTDTKQGTLVESGLAISESRTSAFGNTVLLGQGSLYMYTPSGLIKFGGSDDLTSYAYGYLSEAVAIVTEHRTLSFYPRGATEPSYSKTLDSDTEVICIREQASGSEYVAIDIPVVSSNITGSYFIPIAASQGSLGSSSILPGAMVSFASARSGGYISIACDDRSISTFRMGRDGPIATFLDEGQIRDMVMIDSGMKMYVLHEGGSILALKPSTGDIYGWTNLSSAVKGMVLGEDGTSVYALDGNAIMSVSGATGAQVFSGADITAFAVPGSNNLIVCQNGLVSFFDRGRGNALWDSEVGGMITGTGTDFGATFVLIWTEEGDLFTYDNSQPSLGARVWWMAAGTLLMLELFILVGLAWGRGVVSNGPGSLIALFAGAMAGLIVTIVFPNQSVVDWFGGEVPVAAIVMASGAVACYAAWESNSGFWSIILGVLAGSITAAITGIIMMFLLWAGGMQFGEEDAFFTSLVNSVPIGFTASVAAGVVGFVLVYLYAPGESKKTRG